MAKNTEKNARPCNYKARQKWNKENLVTVPLAVRPGVRDNLTAAAKAAGASSRTKYILHCCGELSEEEMRS